MCSSTIIITEKPAFKSKYFEQVREAEAEAWYQDMCFDGGVGHSGENVMKARFKDDLEKIIKKHPNVTLKQLYEDACYYPYKKKYFKKWKVQKSPGTVQNVLLSIVLDESDHSGGGKSSAILHELSTVLHTDIPKEKFLVVSLGLVVPPDHHLYQTTGKPTWTCNEKCLTKDDFTDETMLSADMGLYYDFTVNEATSRVSGYGQDGKISCPGLIGTDSNGKKIPGLNQGK